MSDKHSLRWQRGDRFARSVATLCYTNDQDHLD
jgi:hypothetical protein